MCLVKEFFDTLELKESGVVLLGNNKAYKVRYVLELKKNLLSINMFDQIDLTINIEQGVIKIIRRVSTIAKG